MFRGGCDSIMVTNKYYFSFELLALRPLWRFAHRCTGVVLLPIAFILWIFPFRLACINLKAFGHLCLEPYLAKIEYNRHYRIFVFGNEAIAANASLYEFTKTQYPTIENPLAIKILSLFYNWRFLQVDIGKYCYFKDNSPPLYSAVICKYGSSKKSLDYQLNLFRWIRDLKPSRQFQEFQDLYNGRFVCIHWRADLSNPLHNLRSSTSKALEDTIPFLHSLGYGVCLVGNGYDEDDPLILSLERSSRRSYIVFKNKSYYGLDDVYALANCKFAILGDSGISAVAAVLDKPVIVHNFFSTGLPKLRSSWRYCYKRIKIPGGNSLAPVANKLRYVADGLVAESIGLEAKETASSEVLLSTRSLINNLSNE